MSKSNSNNICYVRSFPDFITMQRTSFCWFIDQGLTDELKFFSKIFNFSQNTEYILYGEEYGLIRPVCSLSTARRYGGNYRVQLIIPIEVRDKKTNSVYFKKKFPIVTLPLMTTAATFILNGCERVIVSQIIRSPGVYFEKVKNQKRLKPFRRKLSTDIAKLRSFLPSGQASLSNTDLFFATPKVKYDLAKDKIFVIPTWVQESVVTYSLNSFKTNQNKIILRILSAFKLYRILLTNTNVDKKLQLKSLYFKWLNNLTKNIDRIDDSHFKTSKYLLTYFNFLIKLLNLYKFICLNENNSIASNKTVLYQKVLTYSLQLAQLELNHNLLFIPQLLNSKSENSESFYFLKSYFSGDKSSSLKNLNVKNWTTLSPSIYFSTSLKDQLRYIYKKRNNVVDEFGLGFQFREELHNYTKSKTRLLIFNEDHQIQTSYNSKYDDKELYTATLIPDYGSWIRFGFQKNLKINAYSYPIKNQEEDIYIQLDKINQKPVIDVLKEIGLNDLEIYRNLEHKDFFYFAKPLLVNSVIENQPVLRFALESDYFTKITEFSRIFNPDYFRLGKIGRLQVNKRLNISLSNRYQAITYEDIFAITDKLITLTISKTLADDIDHLKNRRVRSVGELLQNLFRIGFQRLVRKLKTQTDKNNVKNSLGFDIINATVKEFFGSSELSQYLDQTNPLSSLTHRRRISGLGPDGFDRDRVSFSVRDIHPSHYGRICPIETPEGQNVGLISSLTTCARVNKSGFLETPFWRVINGKVLKTGNPIYLTADIEDLYKIAPADIPTCERNYLISNNIPVRYRQDFINVSPYDVDFIAISPIQIVSVAASLIPFFEHDDANRALMGSNMQRQSVPLILPQKPIVGTGLENQIAIDSSMAIISQVSGIIDEVDASKITIKNQKGRKISYKLEKYLRSNQQTCINHRPVVWKGQPIHSGQILTDGPAIDSTELALGQNVLVGYMPWQGYNFEDAILISERLVYENIFTSVHIIRHKFEVDPLLEIPEQITKDIPNLTDAELRHLNDDGVVKVGTFVQPRDILIGKVIENDNSEQFPESKLLRAIFGTKSKGVKDNSFRMPKGENGRVIETLTFNRKTKLTYEIEKIYIFIAQVRKIKVGDKIAGRHGNKGIISRILPRQDMPFLPDGTPIDIILNPLGVPSRMNVGQLYECLLGLAGDKLNSRFKILPFDEMHGAEMSRILINKKLRQASVLNNQSWLFNPYTPGKMVLLDGRTGNEFENPVTVGNAYMLKLIHLVDDKMHARATGPYSLITQQPLRGKAQHGGQRFGEMEVWALEGFGAAFTLKELLTVKSDDMDGRNEILNAIVKGEETPDCGIPESFKVLLQELRSIGLDISTYKIDRFSCQQNAEIEVNFLDYYDSLSKTFPPESDLDEISF